MPAWCRGLIVRPSRSRDAGAGQGFWFGCQTAPGHESAFSRRAVAP